MKVQKKKKKNFLKNYITIRNSLFYYLIIVEYRSNQLIKKVLEKIRLYPNLNLIKIKLLEKLVISNTLFFFFT